MAHRRTRSSRSAPARRSPLPGLLLFLIGVLVGAAGLYLGCRDSGDVPAAAPSPAAAARPAAPAAMPLAGEPPGAEPPESPTPAEPSPEPPAREAAPVEGVSVALVIDDLGRDPADLDALVRLGVPITYAVLPFEERTSEVVAELERRGVELILHLPMEPANGGDPGPGALTSAMDDDELAAATDAALAAVPGAVGVNNHMGSALSADERSMRAILGVLGRRGLFFLDSRTSAQSVGYKVAIGLGIPAAERQVFLDDDPSPEAIRAQFERLLALARTRGSAIAIGHPRPTTLQVLATAVPEARARGYEFVPVSWLLDRTDVAQE